MMRYVIELGDLHINSTVAVAAPHTYDDGGTYRPSRSQYWLLDCFKDFTQQCNDLTGEKILVLKGDIAEMDTKHRSWQHITRNPADILKHAHLVLDPLIESVDRVIFIRGTAAHTGKSSWIEEVLGNDFDHTFRDETVGTASWFHLRVSIDKVRFDLAHHANMSRLPWQKSNSANSVARKIIWDYQIVMKQKPPHIASRSHNHMEAVSSGFDTLVSFGPCFTLATEYSYRVGLENTIPDIGGIIWDVEGETYKRNLIQYKPERGQVWKISL